MIRYLKESLVLTVLIICLIVYVIYNSASINNQFDKSLDNGFRLLTNLSDFLHLQQTNPKLFDSGHLFGLQAHYLLNSAPCNQTWLLILVTSYFGNVEVRSAMRRTYSSEDLLKRGIRRVFLLGTVESDPYVSEKAIDDESNKFNDIIQGNFKEAYRNLTYKHMFGLKWASEYCVKAKYVIKMDDDIVFNVESFLELLESGKLIINRQPYLLAGHVLQNMKPKRLKANKWYVTMDEYDSDNYPDFLSGWFYITNPRTCKKLVLASKLHKYFWIDDTFVTGILAKFLYIKHVRLNEHFAVHYEFMQCCLNDFLNHKLKCPFLIGPNGGDNNLFFNFNKIYAKQCLRAKDDMCLERTSSINETCVAEKRDHLDRGRSQIEPYKL